MTMTTTTSRMSAYNGNGATTAFAYTFKIADEDELVVSLYVTATEVETAQTITTHYTVSGVGTLTGGNVTMLVAPPTGTQVRIRRSTALTQPTSIKNQGEYYPETHEDVFDRLARQIQELQDQLNRIPMLGPFTTLTTPELGAPTALYMLRWNAAGTDIEAVSAGSVGVLVVGTDVQAWDATLDTLSNATAAGLALMDDASAGAQLTTLGLSANGVSLVTAADYAAMRTLLGLVLGTNVQAWDAQLDSLSTASANGVSLAQAANYAAMRALLDLEIGTDVQAWDAQLDSLSTASANGVSLAQAANYAAMRTLLNVDVDMIEFIIDGGGSAITTGIKGDLEVPYNCTVTGWTALGDQSGSIVVDIWKDTYANFPPTVADTIAGSEKPTITATTKGQDLTLTTWTTTLTKGDILRFNVDSITTCQRVTVSIRVTPT